MEPQEVTWKQVVRHLECTEIHKYLTPSPQKEKLGYPKLCVEEPQNPQQYTQMVGLDCEMVMTNQGQQLCRVILLTLSGKLVYDQWFNARQGSKVTDYLTHITGFTAQILDNRASQGRSYCREDAQEIEKLVAGKIIVGHDLHNDLNLLKIQHNAYIDTVSLFPHNLGLPYKCKLKQLALTHLGKMIQWGNHDPIEDAQSALELTDSYIQGGRGIIHVEKFPKKFYSSPWDILPDAQLNPQKIVFFVLRGSQALGLAIETVGYKSDHDYVIVYDTPCKIDGRLIKLPDIDISFYDKQTYVSLLQQNDVSYLELFSLPKEFIYINQIEQPLVRIQTLRASLGFHLSKAKMKYKRIMVILEQHPAYQWKVLKTVHMKMRFMDNFLQIHQLISEEYQLYIQSVENAREQVMPVGSFAVKSPVIDLHRLKPAWEQVVREFSQTNDFELTLRNLEKKEKEMKTKVNSTYNLQKGLRYRGHEQHHNKYKNQTNIFKSKEFSKGSNCHKIKLEPHLSNKYFVPKIEHQGMELGQYSSLPNQPFSAVNKLQTVKLIRVFGLSALQQHRISIKEHRQYPNLIQLHYLNSASFASIPARECRGMILNASRNYNVVALPYYKFFDYNDPRHSQLKQLDWQSAKVYEKKDGSLAFLYHYDSSWHVASSTVPDGCNGYCFARQETKTEFKEEFWRIFYAKGFQIPSVEDSNKTFIFQLMSHKHIIVVKRQTSDLCLHGVRDRVTLKEEDHIPYGPKYDWSVSKPLDLSYESIDDLVKLAEGLDPLSSEGFVVCDGHWTRIKIKNSNYVRLNWLGELNLGINKDPKKYILVEIVLSGEAEVFCKYCPEWQKIVEEYLVKIERLNLEINAIYEEICNLPRKKFAIEAKKHSKDYQTFLFALRGRNDLYRGKIEIVMSPKKFYTFLSNYK